MNLKMANLITLELNDEAPVGLSIFAFLALSFWIGFCYLNKIQSYLDWHEGIVFLLFLCITAVCFFPLTICFMYLFNMLKSVFFGIDLDTIKKLNKSLKSNLENKSSKNETLEKGNFVFQYLTQELEKQNDNKLVEDFLLKIKELKEDDILETNDALIKTLKENEKRKENSINNIKEATTIASFQNKIKELKNKTSNG